MSGGFIAIERPGGGGSGAGAAGEVVGAVCSGFVCALLPLPCPAQPARRGLGTGGPFAEVFGKSEPLAAGPSRLREPLAAVSPSWLLCCAGLKLET